MNTENETCAYCGGCVRVVKISGLYYAQCGNPQCIANEPYEHMGRLAQNAIDAWNVRHASLKQYGPNVRRGCVGRGRRIRRQR